MTSSSSSPIVLVTGITGFLSAHVLDSLLAAPGQFRIRGTLRSKAAKGEALLARLSSKDRERVELVEVKDTATSDLTEALKDVSYVLHVASPYQLQVEDPERDLLKPAYEGTVNVLKYAKKSPSVKFIGITSSFAAVSDFKKGGPNRPGFVYKENDWMPFTWQEAIEQGGPVAYSTSKKYAEKAAWDFQDEEKPHFSIAAFNPPMIYGPTLQPGVSKSNLNTSSKTIYSLISNLDEMPADRLPLFCHARDVADAHVRAISCLPQSAGHRFLLHGGTFNWAMAVQHIASTRPDLKHRLPKGWEEADSSKSETDYATLDNTLAETVLDIKFKDWKTTLDESLESLLQLEKGSSWNA